MAVAVDSGCPERTCVILPVKTFAAAKTRLQSSLSAPARRELAQAMFHHVLAAAVRYGGPDATYVVTNGADVHDAARAHGVHVLRDPQPGLSLGTLMDWALQQVVSAHARAIVLMSDLPGIEPADIAQLSQALDCGDNGDGFDCALVADRHGMSTNALAVRLPFPCATAFGAPNSYALHCARAQAAGLRWVSAVNPRIAHDIDVPADLAGATCSQNNHLGFGAEGRRETPRLVEPDV